MPLTHINDQGRARMVDVSEKAITHRIAVAAGSIYMQPETLQAIIDGQIKKGDVLAVAQVAGIMAAKQTSAIIPMCHPLMLSGIDIHFETDTEENAVHIKALRQNNRPDRRGNGSLACRFSCCTDHL